MVKSRLDLEMVERGQAESRSLAQKLVMAGQVTVNGQLALKASDLVTSGDEIAIDFGPKYVSRGGEKLEAALDAFNLNDLSGFVCADLGASTGGFTDCLLQHGAARVYAVDVGQGILHWKLRNDPRVVVMEKTNARNLMGLPEKVDLVTVDVSFISIKAILPVMNNLLKKSSGKAIILVKPQFEAGREAAAKGKGVIRDGEIHRQVLESVLESARGMSFFVQGLIASPLLGPKGNREFLLYISNYGSGQAADVDLIARALEKAPETK
jgi:23S rRNA (cytidine1920-2'-O)/16S rRNA (cytidine1409-2'-O)-methyltransferase